MLRNESLTKLSQRMRVFSSLKQTTIQYIRRKLYGRQLSKNSLTNITAGFARQPQWQPYGLQYNSTNHLLRIPCHSRFCKYISRIFIYFATALCFSLHYTMRRPICSAVVPYTYTPFKTHTHLREQKFRPGLSKLIRCINET